MIDSKVRTIKAVDVCMLPSSGDASGLPCLVFSFGCNLLCDHRKEGVDELQGLYHPQPQPQAHGAPHLREEAGQAELQKISPCHHHLAGEAEKKGGICFVSVFVVVQGRGQSESWLPSIKSLKVTKELLPEIKLSQCNT